MIGEWSRTGFDPEVGTTGLFRARASVFELGILTTDENGDGALHINMYVELGTYPAQFWLSSYPAWGVKFNTGAYFGDYFLLEIL